MTEAGARQPSATPPRGVRTAIVGLGVTGLSCLRYLAPEEPLLVLDTRDAPPNAAAARRLAPDATFLFGGATSSVDFRGIERVLVSPGVSLGHQLVGRAAAAGARVESDIDLFCQAADAPVYAITGTNGKSTVTALTGHLLQHLGRQPGVGGNLGEAALDLLSEAHDCYVLELSSFQLERMGSYPFRAASVLNVSEDHLDRHGNLAAYAQSKRRIYARAERAVANRADPHTWPDNSVPELVTFAADVPSPGNWGVGAGRGGRCTDPSLLHGDEPVLRAADLPLAGAHNVLNVLAAFALVATEETADADLAEAVLSFRGLPHRCEKVAEVAGVSYVDDSKATNVGAALAALEGLAGSGAPRLVLIAGGDGKDADFSPLTDPLGRLVKAAVVLGRDAERIAAVVPDTVPCVRVADMDEAVAAATRAAAAGDIVLLSPACASLDMFENYIERGRAFRTAVESLA